MKPHVLHALSSEVAYGLHELLRTDAANIQKSEDWFILFSLLEVVGAGVNPSPVFQSPTSHPSHHKHHHQSQSAINAESDSECSDCITISTTDKGYTSDSEIYRRSDYIVVSHNDLEPIRNSNAVRHDRRALNKSCEIISFLIRDLAYVTQENFEYSIHCIRIFIEAIIKEQNEKQKSSLSPSSANNRNIKQIRKATSTNSLNEVYEQTNQPVKQSPRSEYNDKLEYETTALQLLDLMHTLHIRAAQIYKQIPADQTTSSVLWYKCWCPILQGLLLNVINHFEISNIFRYCSSLL
jgi:brefeldin A-resistance guanine nucleotide exchange factor 1